MESVYLLFRGAGVRDTSSIFGGIFARYYARKVYNAYLYFGDTGISASICDDLSGCDKDFTDKAATG